MLEEYSGISPKCDILLLRRLGEKFRGRSFLHINSTRAGGGVAEILQRMIPLCEDIGINARWDLEADAVLVHDPQPAPLVKSLKSGVKLWRCHIDISTPYLDVYNRLQPNLRKYNAAVFSVSKFARAMGIDEFIIPPSIDPLSDKNRALDEEEIIEIMDKLQIPTDRPIILQVSRFDRFKDPIGVINAYTMVKKYNDCILVLAGSPATDDPEGEVVLEEVKEYASQDPDIYILLLPPYSDREINALQRVATVVLQKSLKEGFGLTVSEAMWKGKPVIGGDIGGIPLQIVHGHTGFLVHSVDGAAFRIRQFLNNPEMARRMGGDGKEYVRNNFLITRQLRDYLALWYTEENRGKGHIFELSAPPATTAPPGGQTASTAQ
jgi:trehalose synthase